MPEGPTGSAEAGGLAAWSHLPTFIGFKQTSGPSATWQKKKSEVNMGLSALN